MTVGLALRANPRAPFVRARLRYLQRRRVSIAAIAPPAPPGAAVGARARRSHSCALQVRGSLALAAAGSSLASLATAGTAAG